MLGDKVWFVDIPKVLGGIQDFPTQEKQPQTKKDIEFKFPTFQVSYRIRISISQWANAVNPGPTRSSLPRVISSATVRT